MTNRSETIRVRFSPQEIVELDEQAKHRGFNRSSYVRKLVRLDRRHKRLLG